MLKEELKKKIPEKYRLTPEFNILLKIIKEQKLDTKDKLKKYIADEIKTNQEWLDVRKKANSEGTMNRWMIQRARKIEFYKTLKNKILQLL